MAALGPAPLADDARLRLCQALDFAERRLRDFVVDLPKFARPGAVVGQLAELAPELAQPDYALYRGIEQALPRTVEKYGDALDRLAKKAFPD